MKTSTIDLLVFINGENIHSTIDKSIEKIIGNNIRQFNTWSADVTKQIVIMLDGYDEIQNTSSTNIAQFAKRPNKNIVFVMSTRRHKTDEILSGDQCHLWTVFRCLGVQCGESLSKSYMHTTDDNERKQILHRLQKYDLHTSPVFIRMASKLYTEDKLGLSIKLSAYNLVSLYYNEVVMKYDKSTKIDMGAFYNALGYYAIRSNAIDDIPTFHGKPFKVKPASDDDTFPYGVPSMDNTEVCLIALGGILYRYNSGIQYGFVHDTFADFATALFVYNAKLWRIIDCLHEYQWSMVQYYLLTHSLQSENSDHDLWHHQVLYSFEHDKQKGISCFIIYVSLHFWYFKINGHNISFPSFKFLQTKSLHKN